MSFNVNTIAIVDYGMGNLHSVARALHAAAPEATVRIARQPHDIAQAARIVLPGQGAMPDCMRTLAACGLREAVLKAAAEKPMLGVCLGEHMLFAHSDEGDTAGLGLFPGRVTRFAGSGFVGRGDLLQTPSAAQDPATALPLKVPHMGWNRVRQTQEHPVWQGIADQTFFYFAHSYYAVPASPALTIGESDYGLRFTCAVTQANIVAVQFHPEKSAEAGLQLYRNFVHWNP